VVFLSRELRGKKIHVEKHRSRVLWDERGGTGAEGGKGARVGEDVLELSRGG